MVLLLVTAPYLYAFIASGSQHVFGGFLLNPIDGNSYLAKMHQGWSGQWRFRLPYTAHPGKGAYLFMFYIALGHAARIVNLPLGLVFHAARISSVICLLVTLAGFYERVMTGETQKRLAFGIAALGSGLGWLAVVFGLFTMDFWVAETYPFLASYANPHFPLGLALMIYMLPPREKQAYGILVTLSILLALILPFGLIILILLRAADLIVDWAENDETTWQDLFYQRAFVSLLVISISGGPVLLYEVWAASTDPVLSLWHAQNVTPSPPIWRLMISLSPAILLSLVGIKGAWIKKHSRILVLWMALGLVLIYFPWSLQRRFVLGYYIPLAGLAAAGLNGLHKKWGLRFVTRVSLFFLLASPTNLVVLASGMQAVLSKDPQIYLTQDEAAALRWLEGNADPEGVVLSSPEIGLYIPAHSGKRVVYGHPFETVHAEKRETQVKGFFTGRYTIKDMNSFISPAEIDFVLYGPRERALGEPVFIRNNPPVYSQGDVRLYRVSP